MKANHITKYLAFSEKITTFKNPLDQTFVPHFIKKTMFITWNVKRERKRDTDDWFSQYTSNKMQKKKLQKAEKGKKRQIRKGRKKKEEKKNLLSPSWF